MSAKGDLNWTIPVGKHEGLTLPAAIEASTCPEAWLAWATDPERNKTFGCEALREAKRLGLVPA